MHTSTIPLHHCLLCTPSLCPNPIQSTLLCCSMNAIVLSDNFTCVFFFSCFLSPTCKEIIWYFLSPGLFHFKCLMSLVYDTLFLVLFKLPRFGCLSRLILCTAPVTFLFSFLYLYHVNIISLDVFRKLTLIISLTLVLYVFTFFKGGFLFLLYTFPLVFLPIGFPLFSTLFSYCILQSFDSNFSMISLILFTYCHQCSQWGYLPTPGIHFC